MERRSFLRLLGIAPILPAAAAAARLVPPEPLPSIITSGLILDGVITTSKIVAGTITADRLTVDRLVTEDGARPATPQEMAEHPGDAVWMDGSSGLPVLYFKSDAGVHKTYWRS